MKKLLAILLVAGAAVWGYYHFFAPAPQKEAPADPVVELSRLLDNHIGNILGPLPMETTETVQAPSQTHNLRKLRENLRDSQAAAPPGQSMRYSAAAALCDTLLLASVERDKHLARLMDTRAKNNLSPIASNPQRHAAERLEFFQNGIAYSWHEKSINLRAAIDRCYARLRELERQ